MEYVKIPQLDNYPLANLQDEDLFEVCYFNGTTYLTRKISGAVIKAAAGGGAVWGDISGILSNQTDLQNALNAKYNNPTGTIAQYIDGTGALQTFPTIPAAQVNSDWNASSGVAQILNKPTIPAAQVNSDWNASSGVAQILNKPTLAAVATSGAYADLTGKPTIPPNVACIQAAASNETTPITAGTGKLTFRMPYNMTLNSVRASLTTAQSAGLIFTVDIIVNNVSILSTKLTIDNTETTSVTAAVQPVITTSALLDDQVVRIDVTQIGTSGATGLKITLLGTYA